MQLDDVDRQLLTQLQTDATLSTERLAKRVGISKTAAWNRVQRLTDRGVILRQVAIVDAQQIGLNETFFIAVKTNQHNKKWLVRFNGVIRKHPEIIEAHRLAGDVDYLLKIQVASTRDFDKLYQQIVDEIDLYSVTSSLSMEVMKQGTALQLV